MSARNTLLAVVLALQLLIIAAVWLVDAGTADVPEGPWLTFDGAAVNAIELADDADNSVRLERTEAGWKLPSGLPADDGRVTELLTTLADLRAGWPVATSDAAAGRFEVTAADHQRRLTLEAAGQTLAELYLGTSPGYQRVHARRDGDEAVYSIALSNYQVPATADDWLDKSLLAASGEVVAVSREGAWRLHRGAAGWQLDEAPAAGEGPAAAVVEADQDAAADLARRFQDLRVLDIAEAPAAGAEERARFRVTDAEGEFLLRIFGDAEGSDFRVTSDRRDGYFGLAGYVADRLLVERDALAAGADETAAGSDPDGAGDTADAAAASEAPDDAAED